MNNTFLKSTIILSVATLLSKILGSVFRIPLQNIAGDEVLGIFTLVYPVYMVALTLSVAGIPVAISKLISEALVQKDTDRIHKIYRTATILTLLFGLTSFTLIFSFSGPIAEVLGGPSTRLALVVVATTLLIAPFMAVYRGYFQGFQDMRPTAISQVLEQFIRVGFILVIAYVLVNRNYSNEIVSGGVMAASFLGALASAAFLLFFFKRSSLRPKAVTTYTFEHFKNHSKTILAVSIPIAIGAITMALMNFVDSITIPLSFRGAGIPEDQVHYQYGIYGRGLALVQIATVFSTSIVLPLIPLITQTLAEGKKGEARSIINRTHHMAHLISWPAALGLFSLTLPLDLGLFTNLEGSGVLSVIGFSAAFTSLSILGTGILQGMNLAKQAAFIIVGAVMVKIVTNITFIHMFGLIGAGYSTLLVYGLIFIVNTYVIWKKIRFSIWRASTTTIVGASVVMGAIIGIPTLFLQIENWSRTMALIYTTGAIVLGAAIYFIILLFTQVITVDDLLPIWRKLQKIRLPQGRGAQKLKKALWGLLILSLILSIPGMVSRHQAEWNNRTYEMIVPYEKIDEMVRRDPSFEIGEVLATLKEAGLQGVSLEPDTIQSLEHKGQITTFTYEELKQLAMFEEDLGFITEGSPLDGFFVLVLENTDVTATLTDYYANTEKVYFNGKEMVFIPGNEEELLEKPIGYLPGVVQLVKDSGLQLVLRMPNVVVEDDWTLVEQALALGDEKTDRILFTGTEVFGFPQPNVIKGYADMIKAEQFGVYQIEMTNQQGFYTLANQLDMNVIRLHSLNLNDNTPQVGVEKAVRAVKERNIRSIFITPPEEGEPEEALESTLALMNGITDNMPSFFKLSKAEEFAPVQIPGWSYLFALLAAVLFISLAVLSILKNQGLFYLSLAGLGAVALGYLVLEKTILVQGLALLVALAAPVFAITPVKKEGIRILPSYGRAILITLLGVAIGVSLLNGNEYLVNVEAFKGVKLVYVFPMAFMFIYAIWGNTRTLLNTNVKYWHLLIIGLIGAVGVYYIMRTGNNAPSVSAIELAVRQKLEDLLYVRPRTKEFLIGLPLYVLALYILPKHRLAGLILMVPGVIGFLSIINTFTHLHIPMYVSLLRTAYSLVLGLVIGGVLIYLYKKGFELYRDQIKPRWLD